MSFSPFTILSYVPFMHPLPVWDYWYLTAMPLCAAVAIVYKSIRARSMPRVPREATRLTFWILGGLIFAAIVLSIIVEIVARSKA